MKPTRGTRREILGAAAVIGGGTLFGNSWVRGATHAAAAATGASPLGIDAASTAPPSTLPFVYRLQPPGPYIHSQRENVAFGFTDVDVRLSEDCGRTWPHRAVFLDARLITFSHIFRNGNILFATQNQLFLGTNNLKTIRPVTVRDRTGAEYRPHTPKNPARPGWYFQGSSVCALEVEGSEMIAWGNYCNVIDGAAPVNIYYSTDSGQTVKIAYSFGQNPFHRDDGSNEGGLRGTPLGDPNNPVFCRHVHRVAYNPEENAFYACTGDHDRREGLECHWLRGVYDGIADSWAWRVIVSARRNSRYKATGLSFADGMAYWASDANGPKPLDHGIFRCRPGDITNPRAHTMLHNPRYECGPMIIHDNIILATLSAQASPFSTGLILSLDKGKTWAEYDLKEFGRRSPSRIHPPNSDGWFRMDLRTGWVNRADVLFLKVRSAS